MNIYAKKQQTITLISWISAQKITDKRSEVQYDNNKNDRQ